MNEAHYVELYRSNLLDSIVPFWLKYSNDPKYGGYFSCLDRTGKVYDTDKFVWLQCREVWTFAMLYSKVSKEQKWLDFSIQGAEFLRKHGRDENKDWYFSLTREGKPLTYAYNLFSDCFATMAFGQLNKATGNPEYARIATETLDRIFKRQTAPKGQFSKAFPGTRDMQALSIPMILCNLVVEVEHLIDPQVVERTIEDGVSKIMERFYQPSSGVLVENVDLNGNFVDCFEGRLVNPGHGLETMWFLMDIAERNNDLDLMNRCVAIVLDTLDFAWDKEHGGIFYFMDIKGYPPQQLEWDQKLWWVHIEAMIAVLKGFLHTGNERCWEWFKTLHQYAWGHFIDPQHGEWFGYLNRAGEVHLPLKGGKWKGCFHVPRGLFQLWKTMEKLQKKKHSVV
jgi:N-acylglucosamine 2-epimerase